MKKEEEREGEGEGEWSWRPAAVCDGGGMQVDVALRQHRQSG